MIKNLGEAAARIRKAIKDKEKIILYGDADLDGVTSLIILQEAIKTLGGEISAIYFPDREKEGYGLTNNALGILGKLAPAILITVDCGIGNFKEIKKARQLGFTVVVVDHHKILDNIPEADIVVDPKQPGDDYPFKELAAAGVVFKLAEVLLGKAMGAELRKSFIEITALATMADMMPKEDENELFIEEGLDYLRDSWRPGIRALFSASFLQRYELNQRVYKIISILNVRDVESGFPSSFRLLTVSSEEEAREIIKVLRKKNAARKAKIDNTVLEVKKRIEERTEPIIFEGDREWEYPLISSVASIVCRKIGKPTFIYKVLEEESQGTVRVPKGIDSVALMKKCDKYVITYGGHPAASGFRIKNGKLEDFKNCLIKNL
jgi:single-stranded-DNA-specific exonuclease